MDHVRFEEFFVKLYHEAMKIELHKYNVYGENISHAIGVMAEAYNSSTKGQWNSLHLPRACINFDDPAFRLAYLHKYAACHTGMVCEMLLRAAQEGVLDSLWNRDGVNMCSLGGGPGTDIVAFVTFQELISRDFMDFVGTSVLDYHSSWKSTFQSVLHVLRSGNYGCLDRIVAPQNFGNVYLKSDLLRPLYPSTYQSIASADFVTMIKFVSAAACYWTHDMVKRICETMKPGAILLFIDNAAGGFHETMRCAASSINLQTIYGPLRHEHYQNKSYRVWKYGFESLSGTKVAVQFWRKTIPYEIHNRWLSFPYTFPLNRRIIVRDPLSNSDDPFYRWNSKRSSLNSGIIYVERYPFPYYGY